MFFLIKTFVEKKRVGEQTIVLLCSVYGLDRVISIVETILGLVSPSRGGISAVPMAMVLTLRSLMKRLRAISATSTAVVIA
jgi:hypothetical protein